MIAGKSIFIFIVAIVLCGLLGWAASSAVPTIGAGVMAAIGKSEFRQHAERITQIRNGGSSQNGIHMLRMPLKISEDDYFLMGCDNSSADRNFPDVPRERREEGRWFAGADDLQDGGFSNSHGTMRKDGTWSVDSFYTGLPRSEYRASPEEVAWHYIRVRQLRAQNMPVDQRIATMTAEAASKPWLVMK